MRSRALLRILKIIGLIIGLAIVLAAIAGIILLALAFRGLEDFLGPWEPSASQPAWSPDGQRIAFISRSYMMGIPVGGYYVSEICVMRANGSGQVKLTHAQPPDLEASGPAWSPDGKTIVYVVEHRLRLMNADASGQTALAVSGESPTWSPDGSRLAFVNYRGDITLMNPDGASQSRLAAGNNPAWSPDGRRIAFDESGGIWVMNSDGSEATRIATGLRPSWSPDGKKIAFTREVPQTDGSADKEIYVTDADGSNERRLTKGHRDDDPAWSPDGKKIAFNRDGDIYFMDANGSHQKRLFDGSNLCGE